MRLGMYRRTRKHKTIARRVLIQINKRPKTKKALAASLRNVRKAQKAAKTGPRKNRFWKAAAEKLRKLGQTPKQQKTSLRNVKKAQRKAKKKQVWKKWQGASMAARKKKNGRCAICKKRCKIFRDHCHTTGLDRDGICQHCNSGLGFFKDDPKLIKKAIRYIKKWKKKHAKHKS